MADVTEWVWVKDTSTGHLYDIPANWLDADGKYPGVQVVAAKPRHFGPTPRRAKYHVDLTVTELDPPGARTTRTTDATATGDTAAAQ